MSQFQERIEGLIAFLHDSALAQSIREGDVQFPFIESVHVAAISLVVGSILFLDLRLLGIASSNRPVSRLARAILPVTWSAFAAATASGSLLFISNPAGYLANRYFIAKIALIGAAGLNMAVFHAFIAKDLQRWEKDPSPPLRARLAGALSILLWVAAVACGRWIGFTMQGFE